MKKNFLFVLIMAVALSISATLAMAEDLTAPVAPEGSAGAKRVSGTVVGDHYGLDVNLAGGSISLTTPAFRVTSFEYKLCVIPPNTAAACNFTTAMSTVTLFTGSTTNTVWWKPITGTAAVGAGIPLTKSGVAYDHFISAPFLNVTNNSIYAESATATVLLVGGK